MSGVCRRCGCTPARACPGGCWWATSAADVCTRCADRVVRDARRSLLQRLVDRLPTGVKDWLGGVVVDVLWRAVAREQRREKTERRADR